ncbi:MAG: tripartite tricarboxylate transporter substrate binding protein [Betaproteobacteria bacterium]|nr:tripartite tricarboxylate transporter substrate binding protein [Betaproteobacteria bacterium]
MSLRGRFAWSVVAASLVSAASILTIAPAFPAYPKKSIRIIIPFAPGASADNYARMVAGKLTEKFGQTVVVEARPGANGIIATDYVAKSAPDGYTLLLTNTAHSINQGIYRKLPFDADRDFAPVAMVAVPSGTMLAAHPSLPVKTLKELIDLARSKPNQITYGSAGIGNTLHLAGEMLNFQAGVRLLHVPYKGAAPALTDLLAGQVQLMWNAPGFLMNHVRAGKLKAIAAGSANRLQEYPEVPTFRESGLPDYVIASWFGILAPAATPKDIVALLGTEIHRAMTQADVRERLAQNGADPPNVRPEDFAAYVKADVEKTGKLVRQIGIVAEQ